MVYCMTADMIYYDILLHILDYSILHYRYTYTYVYIYIYIYIHIHIHMYIYIYMYREKDIHIHTYIYIYIYLYMYILFCIVMHVYCSIILYYVKCCYIMLDYTTSPSTPPAAATGAQPPAGRPR